MEEKERYKYYAETNQLYDKINDELYCLGIEQDKTRLVDFLNLVEEDWWGLYQENKELKQENLQLKQSQKQLAIRELEKIKSFVNETSGMVGHEWRIDRFKVSEYIENKINKLGGGENE